MKLRNLFLGAVSVAIIAASGSAFARGEERTGQSSRPKSCGSRSVRTSDTYSDARGRYESESQGSDRADDVKPEDKKTGEKS